MNRNTFSIKKSDYSDLNILIEMRLEFLMEVGYFKAGDDTTEIQCELRNFIKSHLNKDLYMWLAEVDGKTAATGAVSVWDKLPTHIGKGNSSKVAYISNMYTRPEYRKMGIASAVIKEMTESLQKEGVPKVMLHALEAGKGVYAKSGFETNDNFMEMKLV